MNQDLVIWLETAHKNLVPEAKKLVSEQIREHFSSAVERYQLEGKSLPEAEAKAIADLGDAKQAAKKFEQSYLTASEFEALSQTFKNSQQAPLWFFLILLIFVPVQLYYYFQGVQMALLSAAYSFVFGLLISARPLLARLTSLKNYVLFSYIVELILFPVVVLCVYLQYRNLENLRQYGLWIALGGAAFIAWTIAKLPKTISSWKKLQSL